MRHPTTAVIALVVVAASLVALTGCAADPKPTPLTQGQRIDLYEKMSARGWDQMTNQSPSIPTPDLSVKTVSTGSQWALDIAQCLRGSGITDFTVTPEGGLTITDSVGNDNGITQLPEFVCEAQHPNSLYLRWYLSDSQLSVLYDYYVDFLQPCLLVHAGAPIHRPPSRASFISTWYTNGWTPYSDNRLVTYQADLSGATVPTKLLKACPAFPPWVKF